MVIQMLARRFSFLFLLVVVSLAGCSDPAPVVITDERSQAEIDQEMADYDKQMAADAASYEKQN